MIGPKTRTAKSYPQINPANDNESLEICRVFVCPPATGGCKSAKSCHSFLETGGFKGASVNLLAHKKGIL